MPVSTLPRQLAVLFSVFCACGALVAEQPGPILLSPSDRIDVGDYLGEGKTVVVGFFSKFSPACPCGPCSHLDSPLAALQAAREDLLVVMVDIDREGATQIDWNSPVAMQFGLRRLPHFMVFGPDGRLLHEDDPQNRKASATEWVHGLIESLPEHGAAPALAANGH